MKRSTAKTSSRSARHSSSSALFRAIEERNPGGIAQALKAGADPNSRGDEGMTPLLSTVYCGGSAESIKLLLAAGADPNLTDDSGNTPLIAAAHDELFPAVRLLVEHGADLDTRNGEGDTPLTNAAIWGERRVTLYLLAQGADPSLMDGAGHSAAELARQHGYVDLADAIDASAAALR